VNLQKGTGVGFVAGTESLLALHVSMSSADAKALGLSLGGDGSSFLNVKFASDGGDYRLARVDDPLEFNSPKVSVQIQGADKSAFIGAGDITDKYDNNWQTLTLRLSRFAA
jgi:hypothetical protein